MSLKPQHRSPRTVDHRLRRIGVALAIALTAPLALMTATPSSAQTAPIRMLVGFPAGGGTDAIARILAEKLKDELGGPVLVDNRPGAGGQLAAQALKAAPADGNTVMLSHDHTVSIIPLTIRNPGFDPARDFVAVAGLGTFVNALAVSGKTGHNSFTDYLQSVRQAGGKSSVGVPAPSSLPEFSVKALATRFQLDLVSLPYRGSAPMIVDMLGGQVPAGTGSVPDFIEHHRAGRLKVAAVMGQRRDATLPEVPTFAELGVTGFEEVPYYGLFAPAGTPAAALERWSSALARVLAAPEVRERLTAMGITVAHASGEQLAQRERRYAQAWGKVIRDSGFVPQ
jgi:tripartite-type tricarboxylate transporter receptor subunit TctC